MTLYLYFSMFEHKNKPLISRRAFAGRMLIWLVATGAATAVSLLVGMAGYHYYESMSWLDAFLNAAMLLGGMGEIDPIRTAAGKLFAGFYALYSGLFLVACGGLLLVPVFHRVLHRLHADKA